MVNLLQHQCRAVVTTTRQQVTPVSFQNASSASPGNVLDLVCSSLPTEGNLLWLQRVINLELTGSDHGRHS